MLPAINIVCGPSPFLWGGVTAIQGLADETYALLADEDGERLIGDDLALFENWEAGVLDSTWSTPETAYGLGELTLLPRTIGSLVDFRAQIRYRALIKKVTLGVWNQLRIAVRWSINDGGGDLDGDPEFALGLCSGRSLPFLGQYEVLCKHFLGLKSPDTHWPRQTSGAAMGYDWSWRTGNLHTLDWLKIENNAPTHSLKDFGVPSNGGYMTGAADGPYRSGLCLQYTRSGNQISMSASFPRFDAIGSDLSDEAFYLWLVQGTIPPNYKTFNPADDGLFTVSEAAYGTLNCLNFFYSSPAESTRLEVSDLAVAKIS